MLEALLDLLLPTNCSICALVGPVLCSDCISKLPIRERQVSRGEVCGWAVTDYDETAATLVHQFKENQRSSLAKYLAVPMLAPLLSLGESFAFGKPTVADLSAMVLVPLPSRRANTQKRGFSPAEEVAKSLRRLCPSGQKPLVFNGLKFARGVADQASLNVSGRRANLAGSMVGSRFLVGRTVLLIDDVVTSGATIREAARALGEAGVAEVRFLVFAETLLKTNARK